MLGSNKNKVSCPIPSSKMDKTCINIKEWCAPQNKGSVEYKGKYYLNLVTGNMNNPEEGLLKGTYAVGSEDYYDVVKYAYTNQGNCDVSNTFTKFFTGIEEYSTCSEDRAFDCGEFIIFKNKDNEYELHQSLDSGNDRHPHDRDVWKNLGNFSNILNMIFDESEGYQLTLPYWEECLGKNCATLYKKCSLVVEKIDSGEVDSCDNPIYNEFIFESLVDKNTDRPSLGAEKDEPTWSGPYTTSEFLNRQIALTVNGDKIKSGAGLEFVTSMDFCDRFEWVDVESGECEGDCEPVIVKQLCPRSIGQDQDGNDINNGSDVTLITTDAPIAPLQWIDVEQEDCLPDCEHPTKKKLTLCIDRGLQVVNDCLEAFIDMTKGLGFNPDGSIFVKITDGLVFNSSGEIEVKPCNNSIVVDECGVRVGQIGVDRNGQPVMAGDCLVTCSTDLYVTNLDDAGDTTVITLSDGSTVTSPDKDVYPVSIDDTGDTTTITMNDGTTIVSAETDNDTFPVSIDDSGDTTIITMNDGSTITSADKDTFLASKSEVTNGDGSKTLTLTMSDGTVYTFTTPAPGAAPDPHPIYKDACDGTDIIGGQHLVTRENPIVGGLIWGGSKGAGGGTLPLTPTQSDTFDYTKVRVFGPVGEPSPATVTATGIVLKAGVWSLDANFSMGDPNPDSGVDTSSGYEMSFDYGGFHNKLDLDFDSVANDPGILEGISKSKVMKPIISDGVTELQINFNNIQGTGGHVIATTQVELTLLGCLEEK